MGRLVIFLAFIVLILMIETTDGNPSCAEDNTAYYGNNLNMPWNEKNGDLKSSSTECQRTCDKTSGCNFWSWMKGRKRCYLKHSKSTRHPVHGEVYPGNDPNFVSGPKEC